MKTTTIITGEEIIPTGKMKIDSEIKISRRDNTVCIYLRLLVGSFSETVSSVGSYCEGNSYEQNYEIALEKAQEKWGIKLIKEVA